MAEIAGPESEATSEFPKDLPEVDRLSWSMLSPDRREMAMVRLAAVLRVMAGESALSVSKDGTVGRRNLAVMVGSWRDEPGLKALRVHADDKVSRMSTVDRDIGDWIERRAQEILEAEPEISNEAVVNRLAQEPLGPLPALNTVRVRVDRVRRRLKIASGAFGAALACDISCLEIAAPGGLVYRVAAVIDEETGIIIGWKVGTRDDGIGLSIAAARDATARLPGLKVAGAVSDATTRFEVELAGGIPQQDFIEFATMSDRAKPWPVRFQDRRWLGSHLMRAMGNRIYRYPLRPRWTGGDAEVPSATMTMLQLDEAEALVARELDQHNRAILDGRPGRVAHAKLPAAKARIREALRLVTRD